MKPARWGVAAVVVILLATGRAPANPPPPLAPSAPSVPPAVQPVQGKIVSVQADSRLVEVDRGSAHGVVSKMIFRVYGAPEVLVLPLTGREVVHLPKEVGTIRVLEVSERTCRGEIFSGADPALIKKDTIVIGYPIPDHSQLSPIVSNLSRRPEAVSAGTRVVFTATAHDPDGDPVTYRWSTGGGRLSASWTVESSVAWTAPARPGEYPVTVVAVDPDRFESQPFSVKVQVAEYPEDRHRVPFRLLQLANPAPFFDEVAGIAVDRTGALYVVDPRAVQVRKMEPDGVTVKYFGEKGSDAGQLRDPRRVACWNDFVYVVDVGNAKVVQYNLRGNFLREYGEKGQENGQFMMPAAVAVSPRGDLYVADSETARIQVFDAAGRFLFSLGRRGAQPGALERPVALACDAAGALYVLDATRKHLVKFDRDLRFAQEIQVGAASDLTLAPGGEAAYLLFAEEKVVRRLAFSEGKFDAAFKAGGDGDGLGKFASPVAVACDPFGNLVVADSDRRRRGIQRFNEKGECLAKLGGEDYSRVIRLAAADNGDCFCLSQDGTIRRLRPTGWTTARFAAPGEPGHSRKPIDLVVGPGGFLYVLDNDSYQVRKFKQTGEFVSDFLQVSDAGQLRKLLDGPTALSTMQDRLFILDGKSGRVQIVGPDGLFQDGIDGSDSKKRDFYLRGAESLAVDPRNGRVVVGLRDGFRVFGPDRVFVEAWGKSGREDGQFRRIVQIGFDGTADFWALDSGRSDLQRFRFGVAGNPFQSLIRDDGRIPSPAAMALTAFNEVWVWDSENNWAALFAQE